MQKDTWYRGLGSRESFMLPGTTKVVLISVSPSPPRVAPFEGNSLNADEVVVPPDPPLTSIVIVEETAT